MQEHRTRVLITVDTEFSMGGFLNDRSHKPVPAERRIHCRVNGKDHGINLIMDILDEYGLRGVFFVESEARHYFGEAEVASIISEIQKRNHEVQLHTHPTYRFFLEGKRTSDDMRNYSLDEQIEILHDAMEFVQAAGAEGILAYRPGNFNANHDTLEAVAKVGLKFTSIVNLAFKNRYDILLRGIRNDIHVLGRTIETPVTCYKQFPIRGEWNSLQISAASYKEATRALAFYDQQSLQVATLLIHSFELVRGRGPQFERITPNRILIKRLRRIAEFLAENSRVQVVTYRELNELIQKDMVNLRHNLDRPYRSPFLPTLQRYMLNLISRKL